MAKNIYVVEDMAISRAALIEMLEENDYVVKGSSASADKAWLEIKELDIDLALLDINLVGDKDGVWIAKMIRNYKNMPIIFLTAYGDDKTLNTLKEVEPNGYLMKPYNTPTLVTLIDIACKSFKNSQENKVLKNTKSATIIVKTGNEHIKLKLNDIRYFMSDGNYLEIVMVSNKHLIREKLSDFLKKVPNNVFVQVHRRYAINLAFVEKMTLDSVLVGKEKIPVSKTYRDILVKAIEQ